VLEIDRDTGEIVVQRKWAEAVERGKFRAVVTPDWTFVYSPGPREPRLSMFPRSATADALPEFSQHAQYPQAVDWAWRAAIAHWGPELVQRDHPVWH
jgi:hypothetical protein